MSIRSVEAKNKRDMEFTCNLICCEMDRSVGGERGDGTAGEKERVEIWVSA